ncbi:MAG: transcription elongation factor Spt5 [Candidatus Woesearchaeota archaeon]|nr:transcription elongation factor Spt5 [Candidatus Aenigmarchaeota archaeon]MBU5688775.1 transcription elongation factor Spt5 [Candidatus Aenigmarchaeota archaeon]
MAVYAVKTIIGRENVVLEAIANKAKVNNLAVKAVVHPEEIKGYIFAEGELKDIQDIVKEIPHARGIIKEPVDISQIKKMIETKKKEIVIKEGDIVEVVGGPFKGEKGKVTRFDKDKGEVTIELIEVTVPIPITVNANLVSVIQKSGGDKNE